MLSVQCLLQEAQLPGGKRVRRGSGEDRRKIAAAIDALPEVPRIVIGLRYYEALRPRQIAAVLDLPDTEVRALLTEAARVVVTALQLEAPRAGCTGGRRAASGSGGQRRRD